MMELKNQPLHDISQKLLVIPKTQTVKHTLKKAVAVPNIPCNSDCRDPRIDIV